MIKWPKKNNSADKHPNNIEHFSIKELQKYCKNMGLIVESFDFSKGTVNVLGLKTKGIRTVKIQKLLEVKNKGRS